MQQYGAQMCVGKDMQRETMHAWHWPRKATSRKALQKLFYAERNCVLIGTAKAKKGFVNRCIAAA